MTAPTTPPGDVSRIDRYRRAKQIELAHSLAGRRRIYLDINYWVELDRVVAGQGSPQHTKLLALLRSAVADGQLICPLSDTLFLELMKQSDPVSRTRMAALMDELSLGVCLMPQRMVWDTELAHFLYSHIPQKPDLHPLEDLVWSKVGFILGFRYPTQTAFEPEVEQRIQRGVFDAMWAASMVGVSEQLASTWSSHAGEMQALAAQLNLGNAQFAHEVVRPEVAYELELRGAVDLASPALTEVLNDIYTRFGNEPGPATDDALRPWRNLLFHALRLGKAQPYLRQMHISASLHAAFRKDQGRRFEANDIYDFHHAASALAYADAFFTERDLRHLVQVHKLDTLYGCRTERRVQDALAATIELIERAAPATPGGELEHSPQS